MNPPPPYVGGYEAGDFPDSLLAALALQCSLLASTQPTVTVAPVKAAGLKASVSLAMKNGFVETIESARAVYESGKLADARRVTTVSVAKS